MSEEIGAVYQVDVEYAGGYLIRDHAASETTLEVVNGWDFAEGGGSCEILGTAHAFESAEWPDPEEEDDDLPTVLTLAAPLGEDLDEGEFVKVLPEASEKVAWVEVRGFGEAVRARVEHSYVDLLPEGARGTPGEAETVELSQDSFGSWIVTGILGREPSRDLSYADTTVDLPPAIIPEEGVTQYAQLVVDEAKIDHLEGEVAVLGTVITALREDDGTIDPEGNIVKLSALPDSNLIEALVPTGDVDGEGNLLYRPLLSVPSRAKDPNGDPIALDLFDATMRGGSVTARSLTAAGDKSEGDVSSVEAGSRMVVRNVVSDPTSKPSIDFGPRTRRWSAVAERYEVGWGVSGGNVVQARVTVGDAAGINYATAVFINPDTGTLDHAVNLKLGSSNSLFPFQKFAGFTATNNWLYALFTFDTNVWQIARFDAQTGNWNRTMRSPAQQTGARMALSATGGGLSVMTLDNDDRLFVADVGLGLSPNSVVWHPTDTYTTAEPFGCSRTPDGRIYISMGGRVRCYGPAYNEQSDRSWSTPGGLTAFGQLPDGTFATTSGDGTLTVYNNEVVSSGSRLYAAWTKRHTPSGRETLMSDVATRNWPARMFATIYVDELAPGTDDSTIYAGGVSGSRTDLHRVLKSVGSTRVTIAQPPTGGASPPIESSFVASGDPGDIVSEANAVNGEPLAAFPGDGRVHALLGSAGQVGSREVATSMNANVEYSVTFAQPFPEPPVVFLQPQGGAGPQQIEPLTVRNVTATGFEFLIRRVGGDELDVTVGWHAMPATQ